MPFSDELTFASSMASGTYSTPITFTTIPGQWNWQWYPYRCTGHTPVLYRSVLQNCVPPCIVHKPARNWFGRMIWVRFWISILPFLRKYNRCLWRSTLPDQLLYRWLSIWLYRATRLFPGNLSAVCCRSFSFDLSSWKNTSITISSPVEVVRTIIVRRNPSWRRKSKMWGCFELAYERISFRNPVLNIVLQPALIDIEHLIKHAPGYEIRRRSSCQIP